MKTKLTPIAAAAAVAIAGAVAAPALPPGRILWSNVNMNMNTDARAGANAAAPATTLPGWSTHWQLEPL